MSPGAYLGLSQCGQEPLKQCSVRRLQERGSEEHTRRQVREGNGEEQSLLLGDGIAEKKGKKWRKRMVIFHPRCFFGGHRC